MLTAGTSRLNTLKHRVFLGHGIFRGPILARSGGLRWGSEHLGVPARASGVGEAVSGGAASGPKPRGNGDGAADQRAGQHLFVSRGKKAQQRADGTCLFWASGDPKFIIGIHIPEKISPSQSLTQAAGSGGRGRKHLATPVAKTLAAWWDRVVRTKTLPHGPGLGLSALSPGPGPLSCPLPALGALVPPAGAGSGFPGLPTGARDSA